VIARVFVQLPCSLAVPDRQEYPVAEYEDRGYRISIFPPGRGDRSAQSPDLEYIKVEGREAFEADVFRIDFQKDTFDRAEHAPLDPPELLVQEVVNSFLVRLRHVSNAAHVRPLSFPLGTWRVEYLNDDETKPEKQEGLVSGRGCVHCCVRCVGLSRDIWDRVHALPPDYQPPLWDSLLLDASEELPNVGATMVLACTALEVFISRILHNLAPSTVTPLELWKWINHRGDWRKEPSVGEQYDALLSTLAGHSLKEDNALWEAFKSIKKARDSFVHEGVTTVGADCAPALLISAAAIIARVRAWLPEQMRWPEVRARCMIEVCTRML